MISFMITTRSLNNQDMTRILKQWRHDFAGKHLRDRCCMDIMWCLCGGQHSWFCKASLRICYVSLFECKGPECKCRGSTAAVLVFYVFNRKRKAFAAEETLVLHKRELLKYHEYFSVLVFEGNLPIEIAL